MAEFTVIVTRTVLEELSFDVQAETSEEAVAIARKRYAEHGYSASVRTIAPDWSAAEIWEAL